jgi:hypothetical protein
MMIGKVKNERPPECKMSYNQGAVSRTRGFVSSSVESIKGHINVIVFVDAVTGYRWIHGMKNGNDALHVLKRWYSDIADLQAKHSLVVLMREMPLNTNLKIFM